MRPSSGSSGDRPAGVPTRHRAAEWSGRSWTPCKAARRARGGWDLLYLLDSLVQTSQRQNAARSGPSDPLVARLYRDTVSAAVQARGHLHLPGPGGVREGPQGGILLGSCGVCGW